MSKCENCIHIGVCLFTKDKVCDHFKDKSLFVELPVKVGQMVYRIASYGNSRNQIISNEIEENQVIAIYMQEELKTQYNRGGIEISFDTTYAEGYDKEDIGELIYLTKEQAEAKLKEIEG